MILLWKSTNSNPSLPSTAPDHPDQTADQQVDLLTDLKNMTDCQEWDKQDFNFQRQIFGKSFYVQEFWSTFCLKKWEEFRYYGKSWI
jgi:hypothetical protein